MNQHQWNFIESFGLLLERKGGTRSLGRVLGYLLLMDGPRTLDEIADELLFSKATASLTLRQGMVAGLFEKVTIPGERKAHFRVNVATWIGMTVEQVKWIAEWDSLIEPVLADLDPENEEARRNLTELKDYLNFVADYFSDIPEKYARWKAERGSSSSRS